MSNLSIPDFPKKIKGSLESSNHFFSCQAREVR
jgi:hypothetical protein